MNTAREQHDLKCILQDQRQQDSRQDDNERDNHEDFVVLSAPCMKSAVMPERPSSFRVADAQPMRGAGDRCGMTPAPENDLWNGNHR
jgi:hypothetical protein